MNITAQKRMAAEIMKCGLHRVYVEPAILDGGHHIVPQHQVLDVALRNQAPLVASESASITEVEEPLHLLVDAAYRLNDALLVHRPGDGQRLSDRGARQG